MFSAGYGSASAFAAVVTLVVEFPVAGALANHRTVSVLWCILKGLRWEGAVLVQLVRTKYHVHGHVPASA